MSASGSASAPPRLLTALDDHLATALARLSRLARTGTATEEAGALVISDSSGYRSPFFNAVLPSSGAPPDAAALDRIGRLVTQPDRPRVLWLRDHADAGVERFADGHGWPPFAAEAGWPGMVLTEPPAPAPGLPGVRVAPVTGEAGARAFNAVVRDTYGLAGDVVEGRFPAGTGWYAAGPVAFVAELDGEPVACSLALAGGGVAGVYWVGTVPGARRRGLGRLVTTAAVTAGFAAGASLVTLQATPAGEPLYRELGFAEVTRYRFRAAA